MALLVNCGDHKAVGDKVWEMREVFGPGWRMYYIFHGGTVIMMLGGGHKSSQRKDIERAKALAQELRNEQDQDPSVLCIQLPQRSARYQIGRASCREREFQYV